MENTNMENSLLTTKCFIKNLSFSDLMSLTLANPGTISSSKDFNLGKHNFFSPRQTEGKTPWAFALGSCVKSSNHIRTY